MQKLNTKGLRQIADHYGLNAQLMQATEECSELAKECCKSIRHNTPTDNLKSEIADVYVMISQIAYLCQIHSTDIIEIANEKIDRQLKRIEEST